MYLLKRRTNITPVKMISAYAAARFKPCSSFAFVCKKDYVSYVYMRRSPDNYVLTSVQSKYRKVMVKISNKSAKVSKKSS